MTRPAGSFGATNWRSPPMLNPTDRRGHWIFGSTANRCASAFITAGVISWNGVMSTAKRPRPWVATTRSLSRG